MHTEPRNGASIDRVYLHTNEGPEVEGGARGLAGYLSHIDGGYHVVVDDKETIVVAPDNLIVWAEGGDNTHSLSVCMIGYASQSLAEWSDPYSKQEFERAAQQVAAWCKMYSIPAVHVRPGAPGQAPTDRGIAEHADDHAPSSAGHTDPGVGFPLTAFIQRVHDIMNPVDWNAIKAALDWLARITKKPLRAGDHGPDVLFFKHLLVKHGYSYVNINNDIFGSGATRANHDFKVKCGFKVTKGDIAGQYVGKKLLGL